LRDKSSASGIPKSRAISTGDEAGGAASGDGEAAGLPPDLPHDKTAREKSKTKTNEYAKPRRRLSAGMNDDAILFTSGSNWPGESGRPPSSHHKAKE
jgi:hypothetical protein